MATTTTKPKLAQLKTPMTSTFPSELSALSAKSPYPSALSAKSPYSSFADFIIKQEDSLKTPITPPLAYTDFLKSMSPVMEVKSSGLSTPTSAPSSTTASEHSDCSCSCDTHKDHKESHKSPTGVPTSATFAFPSSAPSSSRLGHLRIPPSPVYSPTDSPMSATATSAVRSPFSARSTRSPYDWDFKSKGRYFDVKSPKSTRSMTRQVREIVTRTVTYTPRMSPAPKGKRRKLD